MESYQRLFDIVALENLQMRAEHWVLKEFWVASTIWQIAAILLLFGLAQVLSRLLTRRMRGQVQVVAITQPVPRSFIGAVMAELFPLAALLLVLVAMPVARAFDWPNLLLATCANLLAAWIVIRLLTFLIRNEFLARSVAVLAFGVATLNIVGLLEATIVKLDQTGIQLGAINLSLLDIMRGAVQVTIFLWVAFAVSQLVESRVQRAAGMTPSLRVLTGKLLRVTLVSVALVVALSSIGIDLTAFALITGALGVGLGFGMKTTISNLISGLLLLFDRSIKPGDVLELSDPADRSVQLFGWVTSLNARYVSLTTRDGTEWLIPNEELITTRIVNWTYSHNQLRLLTPIGVSFDCDVRLAMQLAEEAAKSTSRVLADPAPVCRLMSFGDSAVNLEMRFWIEDPTNGIINVRSEVLLKIWERYREHGIRTPLGHRDLHIKKDSELTVTMKPRPRDRPI